MCQSQLPSRPDTFPLPSGPPQVFAAKGFGLLNAFFGPPFVRPAACLLGRPAESVKFGSVCLPRARSLPVVAPPGCLWPPVAVVGRPPALGLISAPPAAADQCQPTRAKVLAAAASSASLPVAVVCRPSLGPVAVVDCFIFAANAVGRLPARQRRLWPPQIDPRRRRRVRSVPPTIGAPSNRATPIVLSAPGPGAPPGASSAGPATAPSRTGRTTRFQYLPLRDSPNENPHVELALQPGELLLVHGPMDEDRFYWGETLDGRAGLVPSNFVQRVPERELHQMLPHQSTEAVVTRHCPAVPSTSAASSATQFCLAPSSSEPANARSESPSFALAVPQHLAKICHDFSDSDQQQQQQLPDSVCPYPPADASRVTVTELPRPPEQSKVLCPRDLQVERRLSRSLLLSWLPPEGGGMQQPVSQYQVCVNGQVRAVVPGSFKCRALLEDLELDKFVNVSIRAVGPDGQTSPDAACTLAVGAEAPVAPQHVRISQVTPTSAQLSWYPSNSGAEHVVLLNALKVGVCPPTVFQVQLNGLSPSSIYRLGVRTKHPRAVLEKRPVERCVDFKTLAKIGLPDPPSQVQAEPGPQPGTLLVSWRPNSAQPRPPSRAAVHGYLIYADGRCIVQIPGATADHALLRLADFADDPPVFITVRTRTREGVVSADSNVVRVPRGAEAENPEALLSCSLPSHILGQLVTTSNGPVSSSSAAAALADRQPLNSPPVRMQRMPAAGQQLLLMPAALPSQTQSAAHRRDWQQQQMPAGPINYRHQQQHQYFTFHPMALDKQEFTQLDERPDVLAMEQNYLLRHQQRQRLRSATPERRSFLPQANRLRAAVLAGATQPPPITDSGGHFVPIRPLPLARLQNEENGGGGADFVPVGSTRSEPDLRPSRVAGSREESRWFVAVQDHQPSAGLAAAEELPFRRHQLVKVYGDVDGSGCYWAEVRGRFGLVPAGKLVEIAKDDLFLAAEQRRPAEREATAGPSQQPSWPTAAGPSGHRRMRWGSIKSRSYEYAAEGGQHRRRQQQASAPFGMGGSDQETSGNGGGAQWHTNSLGSARGWGPPARVERRMSALEPNHQQQHQPPPSYQPHQFQATSAGGGYRLPMLLNGTTATNRAGGASGWNRPEEESVADGGGGPSQELLDDRRVVADEFGDINSVQPRCQLMVAKYDYDSRQLSPNVDADQVELSFRQGDLITVYGAMDEDGFYLGELGGVRGLVPSNFLQSAPEPAQQSRPKGVAFSSDLAAANDDAAANWPPNAAMAKTAATALRRPAGGQPLGGRQGSTAAATARLTGSTGMTSKAFKLPGIAQPAPGAKPLTKKSSDLSAKTLQQQPASRKASQATTRSGQGPPGALKRKG